MSEPRNFVIRGEHILMGFLRAFFSQETLFDQLENEFRFIDNVEENSLIIQMTGDFDHETPDALPCIILQEGGFNEQMRRIDQLTTWDWNGIEYHKTNWRHNYTIHCIARFRGTSKLLQGVVGKALSSFRQAIYQMGVDKIFPLQGNPPVRLDPPTNTRPDSHDCAIGLSMQLANDWMLRPAGDPVEEIFVRAIGIIDRTRYDENGNAVLPPEIMMDGDDIVVTQDGQVLEHDVQTVSVDTKFDYGEWLELFFKERHKPARAIWPLDEPTGSTNAVDRMGNFNLVYFGAPSFQQPGLVDDPLWSVGLDAPDSIKHADLGSEFHPTASFSFGGWFRADVLGDRLSGTNSYNIRTNPDGTVTLELTDDADTTLTVSGGSVSAGDKIFVVGTYNADAKEAALHINNDLVEALSDGTLTEFSSGAANMTIDVQGAADVQFFSPHLLSREEILHMHQVGIDQFEAV